MKNHFQLNPNIHYLNHGSFGACPKPIFESYQNWQRQLEYEPVDFVVNQAPQAYEKAKEALATYLAIDKANFFFVQNPTYAVNQVVHSLNLAAGDEVLTTNHEYGAMDKTFEFYARSKGFKYVKQEISLPLRSKEQFIEQFWKGYSSKTKVVFLSHITSATALIFPVHEICEEAKKRGLITLIDGAHAPGHINMNLAKLQADVYTGTLHKWMLAPKGSAFLYVAPHFQTQIKPLVVSWGYENPDYKKSKFLNENEYIGTRDISAFLCTPDVIRFLEANHWHNESAACKKQILDLYPECCALAHAEPICTLTDDFLGQMCAIPIKTQQPLLLKQKLYDEYHIQVPITQLGSRYFMRVSLNAYNTNQDIEQLKTAIEKIVQ